MARLPLDSNRGAKAAWLVDPAVGTTSASLRPRLLERARHAHDDKAASKSRSSQEAQNSEDLPETTSHHLAENDIRRSRKQLKGAYNTPRPSLKVYGTGTMRARPILHTMSATLTAAGRPSHHTAHTTTCGRIAARHRNAAAAGRERAQPHRERVGRVCAQRNEYGKRRQWRVSCRGLLARGCDEVG